MRLVLGLLLIPALALGLASAFAAEPPFTMTDDGSAFVYRSRPGDQPGAVAAMFGIGPKELPGFLTANGITDPTRVGVGHVYRIPNPLAAQAAEATAKAQSLERDVRDMRGRATSLER